MSSEGLITSSRRTAAARGRASEVADLKTLTAPAEGGTKKEYEEFLEIIASHITVNWEEGNDIGELVRYNKEPILPTPKDISDEDQKSRLKLRMWEISVQTYCDRENQLKRNKHALFALIKDGVSKMIRSKLKSKYEFTKSEVNGDVLWLLEALDDIMLNFENNKPNILALDDQNERIAKLRQKESMGNEVFIKLIQKELKVLEKHGGSYLWGTDQEKEKDQMMNNVLNEYKQTNNKEMPEKDKSDELARIKGIIQEKIISMAIIKRSCTKRYKTLKVDLQNSFLKGRDDYPTTIEDALHLLNNYKCEKTTESNARSRSAATSFMQMTGGANIEIKFLKGTNGSFFPEVICRRCGMRGHYQSRCPIAINERGTRMVLTPTTEGSVNEEGDDEASDRQSSVREEANTERATDEVRNNNGIALNQSHINAHINPNWILLDSESSQHIFRSHKLLTDVEPMTNGESLRLYTNGGYIDTYKKGKFGKFSVWFNPNSLANILSLALVTEEYRVTMDSEVEDAFVVHISDKHSIKFKKDDRGLYYFDTSKIDLSKLTQAFNFLTTVAHNKRIYGARDLRKADEAKELNRRINHVAKNKYIRLIKDNWIRNAPITVADIRRSHAIYGLPIPPLKGRTKYRESSRIPDSPDIIPIPRAMYENLKQVTLCADFHFVDGVTVFHTISRKIGYRTVSFPINRTATTILSELRNVFKIYNARGFRIIEVHADNEFEKVEKDLLPIRLRTVGTDEHVPEIERSIQTQKNENRAVCYAMPYKCIPRVMVREIVAQGNVFLNAFGNEESAKIGMSPRNIIDNLPHIDYNDIKYEFGQYVQLHVSHKFTNNMKSRTVGAIVLGPTNLRGRYNFMSLETGSKVNGRVVAEIPITDEVIERVEELGLQQQQPFRASRMLKYEWGPGIPIGDDDRDVIDSTISPYQRMMIPSKRNQHHEQPLHQGADENGSDIESLNDDSSIVNENSDGIIIGHDEGLEGGLTDQEGVEAQGATTMEVTNNQYNIEVEAQRATNRRAAVQGAAANEMVNHDVESEVDEDDIYIKETKENTEVDEDNIDIKETKENSETQFEALDFESEEDNEYVDDNDSIEERRNLERERRGAHFEEFVGTEYGKGKRKKKANQAYSFLQTQFSDLNSEEKNLYFKHAWSEYNLTGKTNMLERYTTGMVFAQMSAQKGIKKYKKEAEQMLIAEFQQLLEYKTFHGVRATDLTFEQKQKAGNMINLIEEKINRGHTPENPVLKGRSCFNGKVQRGLYTKEQTASPTVSQDAFFLTCLIDAVEGRSKAITDVKGAYLNAKMNEVVIMKIIGPEVDLFCQLDSSLRKFVVKEKGRKVLYTQLDKALYGCVQSALLWYELYSTTLLEMGFKINPYDLCVANANIDGKQCTICWYVDDNKISHKDPKVVEEVIKKIELKFGKMSKTTGDEHDFLGMHIKYKKKKVEISMKKHILKALDEFMEDVTRNATTPANSHLFTIRESPKLDEKRADNFHSVVALLLFISKRCRLDIQTAVAFLTTRVSEPNEDDWKKLRRVLQYLRGTIDLKLTLGADNILKSKTWVDVSYGVHEDCRSHTGGAMSWGWGVLLTKCQKQKLNTKSSTEGEIVGVSDYLPNVIWTRMFLAEQGYILEENIVYQDNMSSMKIVMNGKRSSGQKTKHMSNRYFWIKDRLSSEGITIKYCPTEKMVADFFTKPLLGSLFRKFRDVILGYKHISSLDEVDGNKLSEERVKNKEESANGNLAIIDNGQTAKLFNHQLKTTERTAVVDAATVD